MKGVWLQAFLFIMSLFESKKIFKDRQHLRSALYRLGTLDQNQLEIVCEALAKELDDNGLSAQELIDVTRELRNKGLISEIDKEKILGLIN